MHTNSVLHQSTPNRTDSTKRISFGFSEVHHVTSSTSLVSLVLLGVFHAASYVPVRYKLQKKPRFILLLSRPSAATWHTFGCTLFVAFAPTCFLTWLFTACRALSLVVLLVLVLVFLMLPVLIARVYCMVSVFFPSVLLLDLSFLALRIRCQLVSFNPFLCLTSTILLRLSSHLAFVLSSLTFFDDLRDVVPSFLPSFPFQTIQVSS